ncbi:alcohol dehydrogenase catalytic domain-containing protein [Leifsonia sp. fls2-241-R2A-40a]|uniref:zinc-dependent alcohol dehydrogenase n=1 Tax=Leifsonia sp. fls2-241-R2A-40a TaxID=3040290 RepID=UPI00254C2B4C|nr:alcohol dehydrogenase catalytic domain-containing protein [Leifsonia sp. fls2-241-R2A-40a]
MKAARWHARGDVRVEEVPEPTPAPDELIVRVEWCGICGTDLEEYREGPITIPVARPHPRRNTLAPIALGHEVVGRVAVAAEDGSGPPVGTRVVPDVVIGCGECRWCLRHQEGLCPELAVRGQTEDGGLATFMAARARTCLVVPDGVSAEEAALVEPASVAVRALAKAGSVAGASVAVVGGGTIGQLVARVATALGAARVTVIDPVADRLDLARRHGAIGLTPAEAESSQDEADVAVEASGSPTALPLAVRLTRRGGTTVALGIAPEPVMVDRIDLVLKEKHLVGSAAHLWDDDSAVALDLIVRGRVPVADLISHRIPLDDVVGGIRLLDSADLGVLKVLVDCA